MGRGVSIEQLLVGHLGLPKINFTAVNKDIREFLVASDVGIHRASDEDLARIAHSYMARPETLTLFRDSKLNFQWPVTGERLGAENTIKAVMAAQQVYSIEKLHQAMGDAKKANCLGCRDHPPASYQAGDHVSQYVAQQDNDNSTSNSDNRGDGNNLGGLMDNHADHPTHLSANETATNENIDSDLTPSKPQRTNTNTATVRPDAHSPSRPTSSMSVSSKNSSASSLESAASPIFLELNGRRWDYRTYQDAAEVLTDVVTWQADEHTRVLTDTFSRSEYTMRILRYEADMGRFLDHLALYVPRP